MSINQGGSNRKFLSSTISSLSTYFGIIMNKNLSCFFGV
jgi:hypothetical protein